MLLKQTLYVLLNNGLLSSFLAILLCTLSIDGNAQDTYNMTNGQDATCSGTFQDDGTGPGAPYGATSYTYTLCPTTPGDVTQIEFVAFSLYTSPNPNNSDYLQIYDGDNTAEPSLGNYTGIDLQGLSVTGIVNNSPGCLTFVFNPNPNGPNANGSGEPFPGWEGLVSCTLPHASPTGLSEFVNPFRTGPEQSIGTCLGSPITFGDAGSSAEPGVYIWIVESKEVGTLEEITQTGQVTQVS